MTEEEQHGPSFDPRNNFGVSQAMVPMIDKELSSLERFADRIIEEWEAYKANQSTSPNL